MTQNLLDRAPKGTSLDTAGIQVDHFSCIEYPGELTVLQSVARCPVTSRSAFGSSTWTVLRRVKQEFPKNLRPYNGT